jgi:hypothetical protein
MISTQPFKTKTKGSSATRKNRLLLTRPRVTMMIVAILFCIETSIVMGFLIGNERFLHTRMSCTKTTNSVCSLRIPSPPPHYNSWDAKNRLLVTAMQASFTEINDIVEPLVLGTSTIDEQAVDAYLEFLDRRYRYVWNFLPVVAVFPNPYIVSIDLHNISSLSFTIVHSFQYD